MNNRNNRTNSRTKQVIEQAKFTYSHVRKGFGKQSKTIEGQAEKQADALKFLKPNTKKLPIKDVISESTLTE